MTVPLPPLLLLIIVFAAAAGEAPGESTVFTTAPAPLTPRFKEGVPTAGGPLRVLTVEERVGVARADELVRVPLFLHEGEALEPEDLTLYAAEDTARAKPIPCQADDIRRDPAGRLSRLHLYFTTDVKAWERRRYLLVAGRNAAPRPPAVTMSESAGVVTLAGDQLSVGFRTSGPQAGTIAALTSTLGALALPERMLAPSLTLVRQDAKCASLRATPLSYALPDQLEVRDLRWGSGPLFAKLVLRLGPKGVPDNVEYTYLVPRHGATMTITQRLFPSEPDSAEVVSAKDNVLLGGRLVLGAAVPQLVAIPAGLRRLVRNVHGNTVSALVDESAGLSLLAVPYVLTGERFIALDEQHQVQVRGPSFSRNGDANSGSLRAFWGQVRLVLTKGTGEEALWEAMRANVQTLTAVVDEPGLTVADFSAELGLVAKAYSDIKYWGKGWQQSAAMDHLTARGDALTRTLEGIANPAKPPKADEAALGFWLPTWAKPDDAGVSPPRPASGKIDTGRLDPYQISYSMSSIPMFARFWNPGERFDRICQAVGEASRRTNGVVDAYGSPLISCFATALNMQIGSAHLGLYGGLKAGDAQLVRFYRDLIHAQGVTAVYGRGQRPYHSLMRDNQGERTDALYEALSDLYLRALEWSCDEDAWAHPAVFGRYADCVDVTADLQHRTLVDEGKRVTSWWRGNFFRTQSHDHRWESWDALPYVGMLGHLDGDTPAGLTEACYFLRHRAGRAVNWSELLPMFHTEVCLTRACGAWKPKPAPPLPTALRVTGNQLAWTASTGTAIAGYRIYRAERMGGPWTFVNTPHAQPGMPAPATGALVSGTSFTDPAGHAGQVYWVTAVDAAGIESRWFADEPLIAR